MASSPVAAPPSNDTVAERLQAAMDRGEAEWRRAHRPGYLVQVRCHGETWRTVSKAHVEEEACEAGAAEAERVVEGTDAYGDLTVVHRWFGVRVTHRGVVLQEWRGGKSLDVAIPFESGPDTSQATSAAADNKRQIAGEARRETETIR